MSNKYGVNTIDMTSAVSTRTVKLPTPDPTIVFRYKDKHIALKHDAKENPYDAIARYVHELHEELEKLKGLNKDFILVPKAPTQKMLEASLNIGIPAVYVDSISGRQKLKNEAIYKAMINAIGKA